MNEFDASFNIFSLLNHWGLLFERISFELMAYNNGETDNIQIRWLVEGNKEFLDDVVLCSKLD